MNDIIPEGFEVICFSLPCDTKMKISHLSGDGDVNEPLRFECPKCGSVVLIRLGSLYGASKELERSKEGLKIKC